jgi:hypothetical protein
MIAIAENAVAGEIRQATIAPCTPCACLSASEVSFDSNYLQFLSTAGGMSKAWTAALTRRKFSGRSDAGAMKKGPINRAFFASTLPSVCLA